MLTLQATEPQWLGAIPGTAEDPRPFLLPGVRVRFAPIGPKAFRAGANACVDILSADQDEPDNEGASDAMASEFIRRGILEWEGVGGADGNPLSVSEAAKAAFVADPRTFLAAEAAYVTPYLLRDAEGNGSAGSPNGTGAGATPAPDTATTAPDAPLAAGAKPTATARPARTSSMTPKPTKPKRSGKS